MLVNARTCQNLTLKPETCKILKRDQGSQRADWQISLTLNLKKLDDPSDFIKWQK